MVITILRMDAMRLRNRIEGLGRAGLVVLLAVAALGGGECGFTQDTKKDGKPETQGRPVFAEADAVRVL